MTSGVSAKTLKKLGCLLTVLASSVLLSATGARPVNGADAAGAEPIRWILATAPDAPVEFPTTGLQIISQDFVTDEKVLPADNPISSADGFIRNAHEGFCECVHYHGTLFGLDDPDPKHCGWGCVIPYKDAPTAMAHLSDAAMLELRAGQKGLAGDNDGAIADLKAAKVKLKDAFRNRPESGDWRRGDTNDLKNLIDDAIKLDNKAIGRLKRAKNKKGEERQRLLNDAAKFGAKALGRKQAAIELVADKLNLFPGEED